MSSYTRPKASAQEQTATAPLPEHRIGMVGMLPELLSNQSVLDEMAELDVPSFVAEGVGLATDLLSSDEGLDAGNPASWLEDMVGDLTKTLPEDRSNEKIGRAALKGGEDADQTEADPAGVESAGKYGLRLENGQPVLGSTSTHRIPGVATGTVDAWGSPVNGVVGGGVGVESENDALPVGIGLSGALDVGLTGLEQLTATLEASYGIASASLSGSVDRDVSPVTETDDGFEVRWAEGLGGAANLSGEGRLTGGIGFGTHDASIGRRVFDTRAEAEAFRVQHLLWGAGHDEPTTDELLEMDAGESFELARSQRASLSGELGIVNIGAHGEAGIESGRAIAIESQGNGVVRASVEHAGMVDLDLGIRGPFGLGPHLHGGKGGRGSSDVDFDLTVPAAREAFETYRATGVLPTALPPGVVVREAESSRVDTRAYGANIGIGSVEHASTVESGTFQRNEDGETVQGSFHDVSILDSDSEWGSGGTQAHHVRIETGADGTSIDTTSTFEGREAVARALDAANDYDTFEGANLKHGSAAGPGPITVSNTVEPAKVDRSADYADAIAKGDNARLTELGWHKSGGQEHACDSVYGDLAAGRHETAADTIAANPECIESLTTNLNGRNPNSGGANGMEVRVQSDLVDYAAIERLQAEVREMEALQKAGEDLDDMKLFDMLTRAYGERAKLAATGVPEHLLPLTEGGSSLLDLTLKNIERLMEDA
jgi:hypothetical protein